MGQRSLVRVHGHERRAKRSTTRARSPPCTPMITPSSRDAGVTRSRPRCRRDIEYRIRNTRGRVSLAPRASRSGPSARRRRSSRWVAATLDIHDRRLAEDALRGSERRFETVFHLTPQPTDRLSPDGRNVLRRQRRVRRAHRLHARRGHRQDIGRARLGGREETRASLVATDVAPSSSRGVELPFRVKDGRTITIQLCSARIEIDGDPCLVNVATDVTDRRASEDALRAERNAGARTRRRARGADGRGAGRGVDLARPRLSRDPRQPGGT